MAPQTRASHRGTDSSDAATGPREGNHPPIREVTPEEMTELYVGLATLIAERERLRKQAEYRQLREEVVNMTRTAHETHATPPAIESLGQDTSLSESHEGSTVSFTGSKRSSTGELATPLRRNLRPERLEYYRGRTLKEHREFFRRAETAFRLTPENFLSDHTRIVFAMQYLRGEPEEAWSRQYDACDPTLLTWADFKTSLLNLVEDPVNRQLDVSQ